MEETLVSFIVAKLAKEKGFKWNSGGRNHPIMKKIGLIGDTGEPMIKIYVTQSLLQKWLRDEHKIHITIFSSSQVSWMFRITKPHQKLEEGIYGEDYDSYESALEQGLQKALKLIEWR